MSHNNLKILLASVLLCGVVLKCALAGPPTTLKFGPVITQLTRARVEGMREYGFKKDEKYTSIKIIDADLTDVHMQAKSLHKLAGYVTEASLIEETEEKFLKGNSGFVFLFTSGTPCDGCIGVINQYARDNPDFRFFVGYTERFGKSYHTFTRNHRKVRYNKPEWPVPNNVRYIYLGKPRAFVSEPH